ncbi:MAG: CpaF family protein [Betaproteobacteria bacterium]|nr:MAG: CpaF family protein [Betaproteobacteria bacterium]
MSLRESITESGEQPVRRAETPRSWRLSPAQAALKARIHEKLLGLVDLGALERMAPEQLRAELKVLVERLLTEERSAINEAERRQIILDIQDEVMGLGPIEPLLADVTVSDILVNNSAQVFVERAGRLELTDLRFDDDQHVMRIIEKIVSRIGRRVDESSPMVDARLPDGSRVNAVIPPLALDGPVLSIRRFAVVPLTMKDIVAFGTLTSEMAELINGLVKAKTNVLISGGTGTGKTTLLNIMSAAIPSAERIITIEDAAELKLQQPHVVRLETRPPNIEGRGEVTQRALVRNSLRMRPDRIIVGEVRGAEVLDMLQAMNTGHEGSMTTIHSNSPRDALTRLENMVGMAGMTVPPRAFRQQLMSALSVVIQISRLTDGRRKIVSIQELTGMEGEIVSMQEIFTYEQTGIGPDGKVRGHFRATGIRPKFMDRLRVRGVTVPDNLFDPERKQE